MDTNPPVQKRDDTLGITFSSSPHLKTPKGLLGSDSVKPSTQQSHLSDSGHVFDVGRAFTNGRIQTGAIVSDRRKARASLGENLHNAFTEWWGNATSRVEKQEHRPAPKAPLVPKVTTHADIVKKATAHAVIAPRDDHHIVVEKFRTFKQDIARLTGTPAITLKKSESTTPSWSHTVDETSDVTKGTGMQSRFQDARESMIAPVIKERVKRNIQDFIPPPKREMSLEKKEFSFIPTIVETGSEPTSSEKSVPVEVGAIHDTLFAPAEATRVAEAPQTVKREEMPIIPLKIPKITPPENVHDAVGEQEFLSTTLREVTKQDTPTPQPHANAVQVPVAHNTAFKTFLMKWAILILIMLLGLALAVIASFYFNVFEKTSDSTQLSPVVSSFFETNHQIPLTFDSNKQIFLETLNTTITSAPTGVTHIYPTVPEGTGTRPATSEEILALLSVGLPGKAMRALEDTIMVGSVTVGSNQPFIIIRSYNFDVLFSGLLEWEKTIQADFAPLFGIPVSGPPSFTDAVRDNKSIRILYDDTGSEILIYSFINKNTVVITSSAEALAQIISKF